METRILIGMRNNEEREAVVTIKLTHTQLDAAQKLHSRLDQWGNTDAALSALQQAMPGFAREAALLKVAAINQLYGTNVLAVSRMAEHVTDVMKGPALSGVDLVERLATLAPAVNSDGKTRKHVSFASKFAHFFIHESYAIYDSYAVQALAKHVKGSRHSGPPDYARFVEEIALLKSESGLTCSSRDMDRYLWLAGLLANWRRKQQNAPINVEVKRMFERSASDAEVKGLLHDLAPT